MQYKTISEATEAWVQGFNAIDTRMIEELMCNRPCDWRELSDSSDFYDVLPMWGTMWCFSSSSDDYWLDKLDGIRIMSDLGFRIYESDDYGYFFGIDGAGFDFYEAYWIPLYKARGLKWHE